MPAGNADPASSPRRIWLCADDYGIAPAVNMAIRDLVVRGRINATSVMVVAPSFDRGEARALSSLNAVSRRVAIGLHLTLTAPFVPLSKGFRPLRANSAFPPLPEMLARALLRGLRTESLMQEIACQIDAFVAAFDRAPDFIDGHQHVQLFPQVRGAVLAAAKQKAPRVWLRQCANAGSLSAQFSDRKALLLHLLSKSFRRHALALGLEVNPAFAGTYDFRPGADIAALFPRFLDRLPDGGVVMCHPGFVDAELRRLDPLTTLREREYAFFAGDGFPKILAEHGVVLA
jgi:predicted glycoside hydrolase/deacetylase ChbG (UPF0249 family)